MSDGLGLKVLSDVAEESNGPVNGVECHSLLHRALYTLYTLVATVCKSNVLYIEDNMSDEAGVEGLVRHR